MARKPRRGYEGTFHHVTCRGVRGTALYEDGFDFVRFLACVATVVERCRWTCPAYCLMTNHYHLVVMTKQANLSDGMHALNGAYARAFNRRYGLTGHVFEARYHAEPITREAHLLEACRYVLLNPVRARISERAENWPWSSCRATLGLESPPPFLAASWLLRLLGGTTEAGRERLARFLDDAR